MYVLMWQYSNWLFFFLFHHYNLILVTDSENILVLCWWECRGVDRDKVSELLREIPNVQFVSDVRLEGRSQLLGQNIGPVKILGVHCMAA